MDYLKKQAINQLIPDKEELKGDHELDLGYVTAILCCDRIRKANKLGNKSCLCEGLSKKYRRLFEERQYRVVDQEEPFKKIYKLSWDVLLQE
jgi:hypothetical protein